MLLRRTLTRNPLRKFRHFSSGGSKSKVTRKTTVRESEFVEPKATGGSASASAPSRGVHPGVHVAALGVACGVAWWVYSSQDQSEAVPSNQRHSVQNTSPPSHNQQQQHEEQKMAEEEQRTLDEFVKNEARNATRKVAEAREREEQRIAAERRTLYEFEQYEEKRAAREEEHRILAQMQLVVEARERVEQQARDELASLRALEEELAQQEADRVRRLNELRANETRKKEIAAQAKVLRAEIQRLKQSIPIDIAEAILGVEERAVQTETARLQQRLEDVGSELRQKHAKSLRKAERLAAEWAEGQYESLLPDVYKLVALESTQALNEELMILHAGAQQRSTERADEVRRLRTRLEAISQTAHEQAKYAQLGRRMNRMTKAVLALNAARARGDIEEETQTWWRLKEEAAHDRVISRALDKMPAWECLESDRQLLQRFQQVEKAGRVAAYAAVTVRPSEVAYTQEQGTDQPTVWGRLLAHSFGLLTVEEHQLVDGDSDHAKLSRAGYQLEQGCLGECIDELEGLSPFVRKEVEEFIARGRHRMHADMTRGLIQAYLLTQVRSFC